MTITLTPIQVTKLIAAACVFAQNDIATSMDFYVSDDGKTSAIGFSTVGDIHPAVIEELRKIQGVTVDRGANTVRVELVSVN